MKVLLILVAGLVLLILGGRWSWCVASQTACCIPQRFVPRKT